jgi:transcriptional/translational regulatory protein YebC/TACO1
MWIQVSRSECAYTNNAASAKAILVEATNNTNRTRQVVRAINKYLS